MLNAEPVVEERVGGKAVWEESSEKREASLRERKAQMILAARQYVVFLFFSPFGVGDKELIYDRRLLAQQEAKS